jgi:hypothetical protein
MGNVNVMPGKLRPLGYQQITAAATAQALTVPEGARLALINCVTNNCRWRDDGTDPTATVGMQLAAGSELAYSGNLTAIRFFEEAASTELNISYYA